MTIRPDMIGLIVHDLERSLAFYRLLGLTPPAPEKGEGDTPAEVDATYTRMLEAGHLGHKAPWDAFWGQRYAVVNDPDGNHVRVFSPLPHS